MKDSAPIRKPGMTNGEALRAYRAKAVAEGWCYQCRCRPVKPGARRCSECLARIAKYKDSIAYKKCQRCGADVTARKTKHCEPCSRKHADRNAERVAELLLGGMCRCGSPARPGQTMCADHLEKMRLHALAVARDRGVKPKVRACSVCTAMGLPGINHDRRSHDRYMEHAKRWTQERAAS